MTDTPDAKPLTAEEIAREAPYHAPFNCFGGQKLDIKVVMCKACEHPWPCRTAQLLATIDHLSAKVEGVLACDEFKSPEPPFMDAGFACVQCGRTQARHFDRELFSLYRIARAKAEEQAREIERLKVEIIKYEELVQYKDKMLNAALAPEAPLFTVVEDATTGEAKMLRRAPEAPKPEPAQR